MTATLLGLLLATFVSEDLACVATGLMIARGEVPASSGIAACTTGIFVGDVGLWALGRVARRLVRRMPFVERHLSPARLDAARVWLESHAGEAIVTSRFIPGTRLPLYVAAGMMRMSPWRFASWTLAAAILWTPAVVLAIAHGGAGGAAVGAWPAIRAAGMMLLIGRAARTLAMSHRAGALGPKIARVLRWEFWPAWLFYAPVAVWVGLLSLRYRGVTTITASNPGMEDGGVVGESKFEILRKLPARYRIPTIKCGPDARVDEVCATIAANGWSWPLVAKPDVGQRGVGVCLVRNRGDLHRYLSSMAGDVILQPYHPGPFEAGVFYARFPGEERGRILSITDKHFPVVIGDGRSTLTELIDAHSRYRLQRDLFLRRHRSIAGSVLPPGVRLQLAVAGNHAQGTTFYDGWHLWTPALEDTIDSIARAVDGFYVGRFDVRYGDVDAFRSGRDVAVVELNGATAEFTNIYDPGTSLWAAYRTLFRQWSLVFAIGAANRRLGARASSLQRLVRLVTTHVSTPAVGVLSD